MDGKKADGFQGWLELSVKSHDKTSWSKKYFILEDTHLRWFKAAPKKSKDTSENEINVQNCELQIKSGSGNTFVVKDAHGKEWLLRAPSSQEFKTWTDCIKKYVASPSPLQPLPATLYPSLDGFTSLYTSAPNSSSPRKNSNPGNGVETLTHMMTPLSLSPQPQPQPSLTSSDGLYPSLDFSVSPLSLSLPTVSPTESKGRALSSSAPTSNMPPPTFIYSSAPAPHTYFLPNEYQPLSSPIGSPISNGSPNMNGSPSNNLTPASNQRPLSKSQELHPNKPLPPLPPPLPPKTQYTISNTPLSTSNMGAPPLPPKPAQGGFSTLPTQVQGTLSPKNLYAENFTVVPFLPPSLSLVLQDPKVKAELEKLHIIPTADIELKEKLGDGAFGVVFKGIWTGTTPVALKKYTTQENMAAFLREAQILQFLNHPNIVRYLGVHISAQEEVFIVTEFLSKGSLDKLVQTEKANLKNIDLLAMAKHASAGMLFLEKNGVIHRDLALRNLLVTTTGDEDKYLVKVADFGLSRVTENYYKSESKIMPYKWCAPEVLEYGSSTLKSDVWSFGVVLWELWMYGVLPYPGMSNAEVYAEVKKGYRLPAPETCPKEVANLMLECWNSNPKERPDFFYIYKIFDTLIERRRELKKKFQSRVSMISFNLPVEQITQPSNAYWNEDKLDQL